MTQDEIVEMAREAGLATTYGRYRDWVEAGPRKHRLVAFAALVREEATAEANERANASWTMMCEKMVAIEREACAKLAASTVCDTHIPTGVKIYGTVAAKAIRNRENT